MRLQEIEALIQIVNRAPMSVAEVMWIQALIDRELKRAQAEELAKQERKHDD